MKKQLIALAVAGAMTAPMIAQADATLYGSLRLKYSDADATNSTMNLGDNASRIGVKGSVETGIDGVTATYQGEWKVISGASGDFGAGRLAYVGLKGDFGTLNVGRQWSPAFLMVGTMTDILDAASNPTHDYSNGNGRVAQATAYTTPKMGGFQAALAVMTGDYSTAAVALDTDASDGKIAEAKAAVEDDETIDGYNIAASYDVAGFRLAGSFSTNEHTEKDITLVAASYTLDNLYLAAVMSENENLADTLKDQYEVVASYSMGDNTFLANYVDFDAAGSQVAVEVQHKLGAKARVFANYAAYDDDAEAADMSDTLSFGYRVDF